MLTAGIGVAFADITIQLPKTDKSKTIIAEHALINDIISAKSQNDLQLVADTIPVKKGKATLSIDPAGQSRYRIFPTQSDVIDLYTTPGENISINIKSLNPFDYSINGSVLMNDMNLLNEAIAPIEMEYRNLVSQIRNGSVAADESELEALANKYNQTCLNFIEQHPQSPAVAYAITNLDGEDCVKAFEALSDEAKTSALYPFAKATYEQQKKRVEAQRATDAMINNHISAPDFTLPDMQGNNVSLSDFRGKYVVVDFWGSWCIWCIKGFPELKSAYEKYADRMEVVGVDCGDTPEAWLAAVEKYKLPWVNLYNGDKDKENGVLNLYNVQGFPTKVLIDPQGNVVTVAVGEDPNFYKVLEATMAQ